MLKTFATGLLLIFMDLKDPWENVNVQQNSRTFEDGCFFKAVFKSFKGPELIFSNSKTFKYLGPGGTLLKAFSFSKSMVQVPALPSTHTHTQSGWSRYQENEQKKRHIVRSFHLNSQEIMVQFLPPQWQPLTHKKHPARINESFT